LFTLADAVLDDRDLGRVLFADSDEHPVESAR
jgi:hypothetical protein